MAKPPKSNPGQTELSGDVTKAVELALSAALEGKVGRPELRQAADIVARVTVAQFSGPLPHPGHLGEYENIMPGAADRIIGMARR